MPRSLLAAPEGDERITPDENAESAAAWAEYRRGEGWSTVEVRRELGQWIGAWDGRPGTPWPTQAGDRWGLRFRMPLTEPERQYIATIARQVAAVRTYLVETEAPESPDQVESWFSYLAALRDMLGNTSNGVSFVATLLAKQYLMRVLPMQPFDAAAKPQGAPGLDIDERSIDGDRVVAEIKTTVPYGASDLGAQQRLSFMKDFAKLRSADARHKFFFVTNERVFELMRGKYAAQVPGVMVVQLPEGREFAAAADQS